MARSPAAATVFSMGDLLFTLAVREKEEGHEGGTVVGELLRLFRSCLTHALTDPRSHNSLEQPLMLACPSCPRKLKHA
eukprot:1160207-Pelagomonas_calceolata.AAC.8